MPEVSALVVQIFPKAPERLLVRFERAVESLRDSDYYSSRYIANEALVAFGKADNLTERLEDFSILLETTYPALIAKHV
jgi:hypothetical protein